MSDVMRVIRNSMESEIAAELPLYSKLLYSEDVAKNTFRTNTDRYAVRALDSVQIPGVTKFTTYTQSFEVVLTKGYYESSIDDTEQVESSLDLRESMLALYTRFVNGHCGVPATVLNVFNLTILAPEYLVEDKVAVVRATMDITYRLTLL